MKKSHRFILVLLSVLFFSIPFFQWGTGWLLFVAFVPLLLMEDEALKNYLEERAGSSSRKDDGRSDRNRQRESGRNGRKRKRSGWIWYVVLTFALFNIWTSYWVKHAAWVGVIAAVVVNTFYMTLVFGLFHATRRRLGDRLGYASLVVYWITFEFLYLRAQINFPWLVLGNGFANDIRLIQWYEWTGALGGTLWALVLNILIFKLIKRRESNRRLIAWLAGVLIIPVVISLVRFATYEEKEDPYEMVVLQPNIDPYLKFTEMSQAEQTACLLQVADSLVTPATDYIVGPETFINNGVWEAGIGEHPEVVKLREFLSGFPKAKMVIGATTYRLYTDPSEFTETSREVRGQDYRYDSFNSAFQLDSTGKIPIYHKSMLVVGVEHMPYTNLLSFLENITLELGGTFRSHGTQEYREAFPSPQDTTRVGPVICWESVFGEFVTGYVREAGAHFLFIVTNDGWWKNTPGHRQHNAYARLRAIETRRSIARSANTGISSMINQRGEELARIGWWVRSGLRGTLNKNDTITFYVRFGDYIGRISLFITALFLLYTLVARYTRKKLV